MIIFIAAVDEHYALGQQGKLLCHLPLDLKHFKKMTLHQSLLMGRKTYEAIGRALPQRENFVLTRQKNLEITGVICVNTLEEALERKNYQDLWVVGGGEIYAQLLPRADRIILTKIHHRFPGADTFFPALDANQWEIIDQIFHPVGPENQYSLSFITLRRINYTH